MSIPSAATAIAFGRYWLTIEPVCLYVDGRRLAIGARPLAILRVLLESKGRIVSTDELREKVWHNAKVSVNSIQSKIAALRRALQGDEHWVTTVRGQGYRFAGEQRLVTVASIMSGLSLPDSQGLSNGHEHALSNHRRASLLQADMRPEAVTGMPQGRGELTLPRGTTPFIGRHAEVSELLALVPTARIVTLTGPYGIGKTRIAFELARRLSMFFPHGASVMRCSAGQDIDTLCKSCIDCWKPEADRSHSPAQQLREWLKPREMLLLLDDAHLLPSATLRLIKSWIDASNGISLIATASQALRLPGERVVPIAPLQTPSPLCSESALIPRCDALQLLFARLHMLENARGTTQQQRAPTAGNAMSYAKASPQAIAMAARIAALAEGVPLALELAAFAAARRIRAGESLDTALAKLASHMRAPAALATKQQADPAKPGAAAFVPLIEDCLDQLNALERAMLERLAGFDDPMTRDTALNALKPLLAQRWTAHNEPTPNEATLDACLSRLLDSRLVQEVGAGHTVKLKTNDWLAMTAVQCFV